MVRINAVTIDELVTGELRGERYRQVLAALDAQPDRWKDCALAFLHEQALTRDLRILADDDRVWKEASTELASRAGCLEPSQLTSDPMHALSSSHSRLEWMSRMTLMAALLLISFTVGWFGSGLTKFGTSQGGASRPEIAGAGNGGSSFGSQHVENGSESFPHVDPSQMQFVTDDAISLDRQTPQILEELQRSGRIDLESYDSLVPAYEGERHYLIPMRQYRVRSKVFSY